MSEETAEGAGTGSEAGGADAAVAGAAGGGAEAAAAAAPADFPFVSGASEAPPEAAGAAV